MPPLPGSWSLSGFLYFGRGQWLIRFFARPPDTHSRAKVTLKPNEQVCHLGVIGDPENVINRDQTRDELKYICFQNEVLTTNEYRRHCLFTIDFSHILPTFEPYVFLLQENIAGQEMLSFWWLCSGMSQEQSAFTEESAERSVRALLRLWTLLNTMVQRCRVAVLELCSSRSSREPVTASH